VLLKKNALAEAIYILPFWNSTGFFVLPFKHHLELDLENPHVSSLNILLFLFWQELEWYKLRE